MGLGATVRCRCFEEGKLKPGPVPLDGLYVDDEGYLASRKLDAARKRLDHRRFDARYGELEDEFYEWTESCCEHGDEEVWVSAQCGSFPLSIAPYEEVWMVGGKICFYRAGCDPVETTHFKQIMPEAPDGKGCWRTKVICFDTGAVTETAYAFGSKANPGVEREFYVTSKKAPFLYEGKYWTAERIRRLLVASIETGNPIRWC